MRWILLCCSLMNRNSAILNSNAFGPDDAWDMASNCEPDEDDEAENFETNRKLIDDVFPQSIGEIEYDLNTAKTA